jgi:ABC-type transport system involved in multi-copper enzyme maturation permease subunit
MIWEFCIFEIKYRLKHISTYVFAFILVALMVTIVLVAGGALETGVVTIGGFGDKVAINSPFMIYLLMMVMFLFGMFMMASFIGQMFSKDFETKFYNVLFTKPIKKTQYIIGRFLGNLLMMTTIMVLTMIAGEITAQLPLIDEGMALRANLTWYLNPLLVVTIPNLIFVGALFIAGIIITKKASIVFGIAFLLMVMFSFADNITNKIDHEVLAALVDPFGTKAITLATKGWTADELNTQNIDITKEILLNRLLWLFLSGIVMLFAWKKFNFEFTFRAKEKKVKRHAYPEMDGKDANGEAALKLVEEGKVDFEKVTPQIHYKSNNFFQQFCTAFSFNFRYIIKSPALYWITFLGLLIMISNMSSSNMILGTQVLPVTYNIAEALINGFMIFFLLIITYFTGELIWLARENRFNQIEDCLPTRVCYSFISKFVAIAVLLAMCLAFMVIVGIVYQAIEGYFHFEIGVYLSIFYLLNYPILLMFLLLSFFLHNAINHKYLTHFAFVLFYVLLGYLPSVGVDHSMLTPYNTPSMQYSDMAGFGNNAVARIWMDTYWLLVTLFFTGITVMTWKHGIQQSYLKNYLKKLKSKPAIVYNVAVLFALLGVGSYIFYNINVKNVYMSSLQIEKLRVEYEKTYGHLKTINQPKIQDVVYKVDIYPTERKMIGTGSYTMKNIGTTSIDTLLIAYNTDAQKFHFEFVGDKIPTLQEHDEVMGFMVYRFLDGLAPDETVVFAFEMTYKPKGFTNIGVQTPVRKNGIFFTNQMFPSIGYASGAELSNERRRKKFGLPEKDILPEPTDPWGLSRTIVSADAHWVSFDATISTSADQIALAPGELVSHWTENGRNYFHYKIDRHANRFFAFMSARYEVYEDRWRDVVLQIYHHPDHTYNLESMMNGIKESLEYFSNTFGPYTYSILRIAEFPRFMTYAQSFPALIPFSEGIGFIADLQDDTIDYPFYVTSHEVAHQWWAHQVIPGLTRGAQMIVESFTEYASLMVVKKNYSDRLYRRQLRYAQRGYLWDRSKERRYELPLTQVENQGYIAYQKGMLVMNAASRWLGEDVLNAALSEFAEIYRFSANPYPNSMDFMRVLDPYVPDSLKVIIDEMFNQIVLYDHKIDKVVSEVNDDGYYVTTIDFTSEKRYYDEKGRPEIVDFAGWLEIGLVDDAPDLFQLEKVYISQKSNTIEIVSSVKPATVVLDPYTLYIDITPHNNSERVR